ncbi:decaprenyl-phosphate phosphoribosyltransferase [candidate division WOR-3 bacterium]|nr:decaprenyl-phosphate phosphoribosyltransferase [candidate division WOR-3 bacterium]
MIDILISMRPRQWIKNLLLFAGLIFSKNLFNINLFGKTAIAFIIWCLLSGIVYIVNDIIDREEDKLHPSKSKRPIAKGDLSVKNAVASAILIGIITLSVSFWFDPKFSLVAIGYLILILIYSFVLRNIVILDVMVIAFGFLLRVIAGAIVIKVEISVWLFICTFLLALFLTLSKRRHELVLIGTQVRGTLSHYSPALLDQLISVVTASTLLSYILYTVSPETIAKFHTKWLILTIPFVLYGIFRYLWLVYQKKLGGTPERTLLLDKSLLINIILWIISAIVIIS